MAAKRLGMDVDITMLQVVLYGIYTTIAHTLLLFELVLLYRMLEYCCTVS